MSFQITAVVLSLNLQFSFSLPKNDIKHFVGFAGVAPGFARRGARFLDRGTK